jgi:hypothetical protein
MRPGPTYGSPVSLFLHVWSQYFVELKKEQNEKQKRQRKKRQKEAKNIVVMGSRRRAEEEEEEEEENETKKFRKRKTRVSSEHDKLLKRAFRSRPKAEIRRGHRSPRRTGG